MRRGREIGRFRRSKQGGWEGEIQTLTIQRKIRLVPNDDRMSDNAPAFRVMLGWQMIGDAWERQSRTDPARDYLRVRIDDPLCPIDALLFPDADAETAKMLVDRRPVSSWRNRTIDQPPATSPEG
ncbi:Uncharacterized conserved protein, DUF736 family [Sphingobium sp. YR657]|uniref:DUF736 domain-containing protein n=1 Tax=Sphingobium sp. YR657 TaxID=1884366 RepID=UPI0009134A96|nr:DUF736 domain-containing protein [Sphingobium sp. YR657]SHL52668.1 Uncharacterized conserved protein, DUF736 family [Sphingobium sp. YR657]